MLSWRILLPLAILVVGCSKPESKKTDVTPTIEATPTPTPVPAFSVAGEWLVGPVADESTYSKARLTFFGPDRKLAATVTDIVFKPWMTSMGHGLGKTGEGYITLAPEDGQPAVQIVGEIFFIMPGAWDISITATVNGAIDTVVWKVLVP